LLALSFDSTLSRPLDDQLVANHGRGRDRADDEFRLRDVRPQDRPHRPSSALLAPGSRLRDRIVERSRRDDVAVNVRRRAGAKTTATNVREPSLGDFEIRASSVFVLTS
jgi:hypothetical protein